jgi:hypothetical protein
MDIRFRKFIDEYMEIWRASSLLELKEIISKDYKAREVTGGEVVDFGFEESIKGWEQGFNFVKENNAQWGLKEILIISLRDYEKMVIMSAALIIDGKILDTANLFFQTFKYENNNEWKLVRSYIEAGLPIDKINSLQLS